MPRAHARHGMAFHAASIYVMWRMMEHVAARHFYNVLRTLTIFHFKFVRVIVLCSRQARKGQKDNTWISSDHVWRPQSFSLYQVCILIYSFACSFFCVALEWNNGSGLNMYRIVYVLSSYSLDFSACPLQQLLRWISIVYNTYKYYIYLEKYVSTASSFGLHPQEQTTFEHSFSIESLA